MAHWGRAKAFHQILGIEEGQDGDYHSLLQIQVMLTATLTGRLGASWTDEFLDAAAAIAPANEDEGQLDYDARWDWVAFVTQLPRPELYQNTRLFRIHTGSPWTIPDAMVHFPIGVDAWNALDQLVQLWPDLGYRREQIPWRVTKVHSSVARGLATPADTPSYIVTTNNEKIEGPFSDVLIEIRRHMDTTAQIEVACYRVAMRTTFPALLAQLRLSAECTFTHECDNTHNGYVHATNVAWKLTNADFITIDMFPRTPAPLRLQDRSGVPHMTQGDAVATTGVEETESPCSAEEEYQGPVTYVFHRPRFAMTMTSRICWLATDTRSRISAHIIERHWPGIYQQDYTINEIHKSFQQDFPDAPEVKHYIILVDGDFNPRPQLRGVLVPLRNERTQELYAAPLATRTSEYGLLHWSGFLHPCKADAQLQCGAWINGLRLHGAESTRLAHADYVKIALWRLTESEEDLPPIDITALNHEEATYEEESPYDEPESPPSSGYLTGSRGAASGSDGPQDLYWICAAIYGYIFGCVLLRLQVEQRPRKRTRTSTRTHHMRAGLLISLLLFQHVRPVAALMLTAPQPLHGQRHHDPGAHSRLPPPGNPLAIEDHEHCIQRTGPGDYMLDWIVMYVDFQCRSSNIWACLNNLSEFADVQCAVAPQSGTTSGPILPIATENNPIALELDRLVPRSESIGSIVTPNDVTPGSHNHVDVNNPFKMPIDANIDDLDDLATPWTCQDVPPLDELQDLYPGLPERLLRATQEKDFDTIEIYTDGSYDSGAKHNDCATWAMIVCGKPRDRPTMHLIDWYGDKVLDDPLDAQWVGATRQHIREAEATALIWTAFYLAAHFTCLPASVYSDALAVLNVAKGRWHAKPTEHIGIRLRAIYQMLERAKGHHDLTCRHVKSHSGILGNELADTVANALRTGELQPRPPPRHYAWWLQGEPPKLLRAHMLIEAVTRQDLPIMQESYCLYGPPCSPSQPRAWLDVPKQVPQEGAVRIKIGTYNANTLRHVGAVALLRQQCRAAGLHIMGLQETMQNH